MVLSERTFNQSLNCNFYLLFKPKLTGGKMARKNTPLARKIMIKMICNTDATTNQVNAAIGGDGSKISESSRKSVKSACEDFEKYPEFKQEWIDSPLDGTGYKVLLEKYKKMFPDR